MEHFVYSLCIHIKSLCYSLSEYTIASVRIFFKELNI